MTTWIPGDSETETGSDDRPGYPADSSSGADEAAQPQPRPLGRGLPMAVMEAAEALAQETPATAAGATAAGTKESPWQRSHAIWRRAGIDWIAEGAACAETEPSGSAHGPEPTRHTPKTPAPALAKTAGRVGVVLPRSRRGRRVGSLAVAAALVVGVGAYAFQSGAQDGPATRPAVNADRFFAVDPSAASDGRSQTLTAVAAAGNTIVALGSDQVHGQFLASADGGRSWRVARVRAADGGEPVPAEFPRHIAGGNDSWVALGGRAGGSDIDTDANTNPNTGTAGAGAGARSEPAGAANAPADDVLWTSANGITWTRRSAGSAFAATDRVKAVVRTGSGFVAVGSGTDGALVWHSPDGRSWQRSQAAQAGMVGVVRVERLAAAGDLLVAQGVQTRTVMKTVKRGGHRQRVKQTVQVGGYWRSADGGHGWTAVSIPQNQGSYGEGNGLVGAPGGFVLTREARKAVGKRGKRRWVRYGVVFGSADGMKWTVRGQLTAAGYTGVERLSGGPEGIAALIRSGGGKITVLRSADGAAWQRIADITGRVLTDLAVLPSATVVTGQTGDDAYLSIPGTGDVDLTKVPGAVQPDRTLGGLAAAAGQAGQAGQLVAVGSTNGDAAIWASRDGGRSWSRAQGTGFNGDGTQRLADVVHGGRGWLAVGSGPLEPLAFTSADGMLWRRFDDDLAKDLRPSGAASGPAGYVLVGRAGITAQTWQSSDLKTWTRGTGDLGGAARMNDVAAVSTGYVAVGTVARDGAVVPAAWTSVDGRRWTAAAQIPVPSGAVATELTQVVARGDTVVARAASFVAVSGDGGRNWHSQVLSRAGAGATMTSTAMGTTARGFVVAGTAGAPGRADVVLWNSADGTTWRSVRPHGTGLDGPGAQWLTALATWGNDLFAVGFINDHRGDTPTYWRTPTP